MFLDIKQGKNGLAIKSDILEKDPDFPKVAITFSIDENTENTSNHNDFMKDVLKRYNKEFNKSYGLSDLQAYASDVNRRLARKESEFFLRENQLDLVIVVDRLLTGFDSPTLSTLFIDREPLSFQTAIQAMSRTNRKYVGKPVGNIVTFRKPKTTEAKIKEALTMYSIGGLEDVIAPLWKDVEKAFKKTVDGFYTNYPDTNFPDDFSDTKKLLYIQHFQELDSAYTRIKSYAEYDSSKAFEKYGFDSEDIYKYQEIYRKWVKELREDLENGFKYNIDLDYVLTSIKKQEVNYKYISNLIEVFISNLNKDTKESKDLVVIIEKIMKPYENNPKLSQVFQTLIEDIKKDSNAFRNTNIEDLIKERIYKQLVLESENFSKRTLFSSEILLHLIENDVKTPVTKSYMYKMVSDEVDVKIHDYIKKNNIEKNVPPFIVKKRFISEINDFLENMLCLYNIDF